MHKPSFATATSLGSALLLIGWLILQLRGAASPGVSWTIAHIFLLIGYCALFAGGLAAARAVASSAIKRPAAIARYGGLTLLIIGMCAFVGQLAVDLFVGFSAANQADMNRLFDVVQSHLVLQLGLYSVGPALFYAGLFILIALLMSVNSLTFWRGAIALMGIASVGVAFSFTAEGISSLWYPLGLICLAVGSLSFRSPTKNPPL